MAQTLGLSDLRPIKTMAAHELVLEQIRTAILLGRYGPGEKLPRERDLAEMLQVSRTTAREAIAILTNDGLLQVKRGRGGGLVVRSIEVDESEVRRALRANRRKLAEIFEFRQVVECASASLAADNRTKKDLVRLKGTLQTMDQLVSVTDPDHATVARFQVLDHEFHLQIAMASKNPWFVDATSTARIEMFRPVGAVFRRIEPRAHTFHHQVLEAIEAGDGTSAAQWMSDHIEDTRSVVDSWLDFKRRS